MRQPAVSSDDHPNHRRGLHRPVVLLRWLVINGKRLAILVIGLAFVGAGLAMLVLPGPGILVSIVGLAILATEFAWAERMLDRSRSRAAQATASIISNRAGRVLFLTSTVALLTGGAAVVALVDGHRLAGASAFVAGLCALVVLFPRVHRWLGTPRPTATDHQAQKGSPA